MTGRRLAVVGFMLTFVAFTTGAHAQVNRDINSYVLFAYDQLIFKGGNGTTTGFINGGNIGVNYPGLAHTGAFSLDFATGPGGNPRMWNFTQALAASVNGGALGSFYDLYANTTNNSFASEIRNSGPTS